MSEYIADLRKVVGHRKLMQVGAGVHVLDPSARVLLELRGDTLNWAYPGGSTEIDERVEETARRELFEETGILAEKLELFCINSGPEVHFIYPNGDEVSNVEIVFLCRSYSGELRCQKGEVLDLRFFTPGEVKRILGTDIFPPVIPGLLKWMEERKIEGIKEIE